jgi:hypothetical protein
LDTHYRTRTKKSILKILEKKQYGVDGNPDYNYSKPFPPPFFNRPKMGTRLYVRSRCRRFLNVMKLFL